MSLQAIRAWVDKGFKTVEQNGQHWVRVRLTSDGQLWQTWEKPFPPPEEFQTEVTALFETLSEELPVRRHTMTFTAEDGAGGVLSMLPHSITGKNKQAQELGQQGAAKAFSDAMRSLAETLDMVARSARDQLSAQNQRIQDDQEEIRALHELLREHRAAEALAAESSGAVSEMLVSSLKDAGPLLAGVAELFLDKAKAAAAAKAASAATTAVEAAKTVSAVAEGAKPVVTVTATPTK
jgi:hypothetical protein